MKCLCPQSEVRNDVAATSRISHEWLKRYKASDLNDYIVRRYVKSQIVPMFSMLYF